MFYYKIPRDIFNQHIIPYTYNTQRVDLLKDISHYCESKEQLHKEYIPRDISRFIFRFIHENMIHTTNLTFNNIWASMNCLERNLFFDYIKLQLINPNETEFEFEDDYTTEEENEDDFNDAFDYYDYIENMD
jgi:hypothetical protein